MWRSRNYFWNSYLTVFICFVSCNYIFLILNHQKFNVLYTPPYYTDLSIYFSMSTGVLLDTSSGSTVPCESHPGIFCRKKHTKWGACFLKLLRNIYEHIEQMLYHVAFISLLVLLQNPLFDDNFCGKLGIHKNVLNMPEFESINWYTPAVSKFFRCPSSNKSHSNKAFSMIPQLVTYTRTLFLNVWWKISHIFLFIMVLCKLLVQQPVNRSEISQIVGK